MSIEKHTEDFLHEIFLRCGEDPSRQGLVKTPQRFLKSFLELTQGYRQNLEDIVNDALFECTNPSPIYVKDIPFFSLCEHHLLPFFGHCQVAYVPDGCVLGLSKVYRIVDFFSKRLQLQERLTQQIGEALQQVTHTKGVWVEMSGQHLCVAMRGVQRSQSFMKTQYKYGDISGISVSLPENLKTSSVILKLKTLKFPLKIGCYSDEQRRFTPVQIFIEIKLQKHQACYSDQLRDTCCYDQLSQCIEQSCLQQSFQLIEHACQVVYDVVHAYLEKTLGESHIRVTLVKALQHTLLSESQCTISDF